MNPRQLQVDFAIDRSDGVIRYLDTAALPESIRVKVRKRLSEGRPCINNPDQAPYSIPDILRYSFSWLAVLGVPAMILGGFLGSRIAESQPEYGDAGTIRLSCMALLLATVFGWAFIIKFTDRVEINSDKLALTNQERASILAATRDFRMGTFSTSKHLASTTGACRCGDLICTVEALCDTMLNTGAWSSRYLHDLRSRFDVQQERLDFIYRAVKFHSDEQHLGPRPVGETAAAEVAQHEWDNTRSLLSNAWHRLCERMAAIEILSKSIVDLDSDLVNSAAASRAEELGRRIMAFDVEEEMSINLVDGVVDHTEHVIAINSAINELIQHTPGSLETLKSFAPEADDKPQADS